MTYKYFTETITKVQYVKPLIHVLPWSAGRRCSLKVVSLKLSEENTPVVVSPVTDMHAIVQRDAFPWKKPLQEES